MPDKSLSSLINKQQLYFILGVCIALSIVAIVFRADTLNLENAILGILITWCGLTPGFLYLMEPQDTRAPFPFAPLVGFFYAIFFGVSVFLISLMRDPPTGFIDEYGSILIENLSVETQMLTLVGTVLMFLTWGLSNRKIFKSTPHFKISGTPNSLRILIAAWCLALASMAYYLVPDIQSLPSVGQFLKPAGIVAFSIFSYLLTHSKLSKIHTILYFVFAFPLWIFGLIGTGSSTVVALVGCLLLVSFINAKNRVPWLLISSIPLIVIVLYPLMGAYRHYIWTADPNAGHIDKLLYVGKAVSKLKEYNLSDKKLRALGLVRRVTLVVVFNRVVQMSPDPVPFLKGETYKPIISSWIPRALWPDKPKENAGQAFGYRYKWIKPHLKNHSMNIPWIIEMYANFGRYGVLLGMVLAGLLLSFLDRYFNRSTMSPLDISVGSAVILPLTFLDSNFSLMTGSLLPLTICLWVFFTIALRIPLPGSLGNSKTSDKPL